MKIDFWYKEKGYTLRDVEKVDVFFYPNEGIYRGNIYKDGKMIGDYSTTDSLEIEKTFRHVKRMGYGRL